MTPEDLTSLLQKVKNGDCSISDATQSIKDLQSEAMTEACIDHQRHLRTGIPEVIYGASKTSEQITTIAKAMLKRQGPVLATRVSPE